MIGVANVLFWPRVRSGPHANRPAALPPRTGNRLWGGGVRPLPCKFRVVSQGAAGTISCLPDSQNEAHVGKQPSPLNQRDSKIQGCQ